MSEVHTCSVSESSESSLGCFKPVEREHRLPISHVPITHDSSQRPGQYPLTETIRTELLLTKYERRPPRTGRRLLSGRSGRPAAQVPLGVTVSTLSKGIGRVRRRFARSECSVGMHVLKVDYSPALSLLTNTYLHLAKHIIAPAPAPRVAAMSVHCCREEDLRRAAHCLMCWAGATSGYGSHH